ncbi:EF hand [Gimesia fumaroli]|uniref:EF hand n=2 Tax=Gimesia fumaroli TaxID=2527976 RepID=A0A518IDW4_9PLAN|nr:EF hand [Gimesia fumaroli]
MKSSVSISLIFFLVSSIPCVGAAPSKKEKQPKKTQRELVFERMDTDHDGLMDISEYLAGSIGKVADAKDKEFTKWDLDKDRRLTFEEFRKRGFVPSKNHKPNHKLEFKRRDRNRDQKLSLQEFMLKVPPDALKWRRMAFFRADLNEDLSLTFEEYVDRGTGRLLSPQYLFFQRDFNDDEALSEEEFLAGIKKKEQIQRAQSLFALHDYNSDGTLTFKEYRVTPYARPDLQAHFVGRDQDENNMLDVRELTLFYPPRASNWMSKSFRQFDTNNDQFLDWEEYQARDIELKRRRKLANSWSMEEWLTASILLVDGLLVLVFVFWLGKRQPKTSTKESKTFVAHS